MLLSVHLPLKSARQRLQALPFAVEEKIADPLDAVHLALGQPLGEQRYAVGVVRHDVMQRWVATAEESGCSEAPIVPDALTLPRLDEGWAMSVSGERALVRTADGAGFAVPTTMLTPAWSAAGKPSLMLIAGDLPEGMAGARLIPTELDPPTADGSSVLDLRQGAYARTTRHLPRQVRHAMGLAAGAAAFFLLLTALDTMALSGIAERRADALRTAITERGASAPADDESLAIAAGRLLPEAGAAGGSSFLPLLTRLSEALSGSAVGVSIRTIGFDGNAGTMTLDIEAGDLPALQRIEAALTEAGLAPTTGAATTGDGGASQQITIRMGARA